MISNDKVRFNILKILYDDFHRDSYSFGMSRAEVKELLKVPDAFMDSNVFYLQDKGLIHIMRIAGGAWTTAKIIAFGIDVIEDKEKYKDAFPFVMMH